jgi:hypothetical protein
VKLQSDATFTAFQLLSKCVDDLLLGSPGHPDFYRHRCDVMHKHADLIAAELTKSVYV